MLVLTPRPGPQKIKAHMLGGLPDAARPAAIALNSNENAYGPSPLAMSAMRAAVTGVERYLENPGRLLCPALARTHGLDPDRIAIGFGSDDLLSRIAQAYLAPGDVLIRSANGYLKVPNYAYANDGAVISVPDNAFVPSVDAMIAALTPRTRIVYLANPENPAGTYLSGAEVRRLHAALPDHVLLVLDCAYEEYVDAADYEPGRRLASDFDNVIVTHTFSKIYGLAGARIGWAYAHADIIDIINRVGVTFPMTSPSAAAALAALEDHEHIATIRTRNAAERTRLCENLNGLGMRTIPSQTNFVLVHVPQQAARLDAYLQANGILIRRFASPAYADYIRITLGLPHENAACLAAITAFCADPA